MIRECESGSKENLHQNMETLRVLSKSFALYEEQIQQVNLTKRSVICLSFSGRGGDHRYEEDKSELQ